MLVMVVFFIAFRWIHLSTPLIRLFLLVLILLLMPTLNFLPVWFALSLLRFRLPSRLPMMFILWMVAMMVVIINFKAPWMPDRTEANPNELNQDDARYGFRCCHLKNIWTAPLPPETELSRQMTTSTTSIDIMGLQAAYANLHTDQERDYFMQRYHDVISSFG